MNLKPLEDRIVVQPNEAEQTTASGLVIPDTAKEKPQQGKVLAVGPGKREQIVAANVDQLVIVASAAPAPSLNLIDRYLVAEGIRRLPLLGKAPRRYGGDNAVLGLGEILFPG